MAGSGIELVIADVNETILPVGEELPSPETIQVVREMQRAGIELVPITSLSAPLIRGFAQSLELTGPGILDGGATLYDFGLDRRDERYSRWLSPQITQHIVRGIGGLCTEIYYDDASTKYTADTMRPDAIETPTPSVFAVYPSIVSSEVRDALGQLGGDISAQYNRHDDLDTMRCVQVTCKGVNKPSGGQILLGSERYRELLGKQMAVIADGTPDEAYFDVMPLGTLKIVMENGELKNLIGGEPGVVVAPHVNDNGFAWAMRKYVLHGAQG